MAQQSHNRKESMNKVKIADKLIGDEESVYTIAEAGANHDSELEKAFKLIDAAIEGEADAIKFQTYSASKLTTRTAKKYWEDGISEETQYDVFEKLDKLTSSDWKEIFEYAKEKKMTCFSTPFDYQSVDLLYSLDVPAFKIASADITHLPLIKKIAKKKLPVILSTGMASLNEIDEAVGVIEDEGNSDIIIMHCITSYPTKPEDANLQLIQVLKEHYPNCVIGYSDHTLGTDIPVYSTFYGACCIEKHFTFDQTLKTSRDHRLSLGPQEFREMVKKLNLAKVSRGLSKRIEFDSEKEAVKYARRSVVTTCKIPSGIVITSEMLDVKRPGTGIEPKNFEKIIGVKVKRDIDEDVPIMWEDLDLQK